MTKTIDESRSGRSRAHERFTPENTVLWPDLAVIVYQASLDEDGIRQTMTAESHGPVLAPAGWISAIPSIEEAGRLKPSGDGDIPQEGALDDGRRRRPSEEEYHA